MSEHAGNPRLQLLKLGIRRVHCALNARGTGQAARAVAAGTMRRCSARRSKAPG
jgi:hypothetical protein